MKVDEVRAGMKGYGLTVWRGTKIEPFEVEVLGVLPKINVGQPLVLVKLSGGPISERGAFLVQGMSGSPIYINGKLLGAFSQGDAWPKEPIGMVTPIEGMLEALDPRLSRVPAGGDLAFDWNAPLSASPAAAGGGLFSSPEQQTVRANGRGFRPLALPVMVSGLGSRGVAQVAEALEPFNLSVMQGPGAMGRPFKAELTPGAAIGISLVTGDVDITAIGTVTYRKGDELLAFGHPWMQIGAAEWPISTAWIHDVFPGFQISHKYGSAGEIVGTMTQDRPYSVAGRLGAKPKMVPVEYTVSDRTTGRRKSFSCEVVNHPLLIGRFVPIAVNSGLYEVRPVPGDAIARVDMEVETEGAGTLKRTNVFFDPSAIDIAAVRELQELMALLGSNEFKRVPVKKLRLNVEYEERRPTATIDRVFLDQSTFEPGDEFSLGVVLRPYRRDPVVVKQKVKIPETAGSGRALLLVHGGSTRLNLSSLLSGGIPGLPGAAAGGQSLKQAVQSFLDRERNDQLVSRLIFPTTAVTVEGTRLSGLPDHLAEVMRSARSTGLRLERDESRSLMDSDYVVQGLQTLTLTIQKKDQSEKPSTSAPPGPGAPGASPLFGPSSSPERRTLSDDEYETGEDEEEYVRFTVDGKPVRIRLIQSPLPQPSPAPAPPGAPEAAPAAAPAPVAPAAAAPAAGSPAAGASKPQAAASSPAAGAAASPKLVGRVARTWKQSGRTDFDRGSFQSAAVNTGGEVRLAPQLKLTSEIEEQFVWSIAPGEGCVYAGTGNGGRVVRIADDGGVSTFWDSEELAVHALARDAKGNLYAGTSPNACIVRIGPDGAARELFSLRGERTGPDAPARYVLALAAAPDGTVYAGLGPSAELYRIAPGADRAERIGSLPDESVSSLLLKDSTLYIGSAGSGAIYRLAVDRPGAAPEVVYTTGQKAITGLAVDKAGDIYAATAPAGRVYKVNGAGKPELHYDHGRSPLYGLLIDSSGILYSGSGDAILRIEPDHTATLLRDERRANFTCMTWDGKGRMVAGSANVGALYRLAPAAGGSFDSTVHDAGLPAKWGRLRFTASLPPGGSMKIQTRSGNAPQPDSGWSPWSDLNTIGASQYVVSPPARYLQYRAEFKADSGSPALREINIYYLPLNRAPKLTLAAPLGGEIWSGSQNLKWSAVDPDSDTLTYELAYSSDAGRTWKPVGERAANAPTASASPAAGAVSREQRAEEALNQYKEQLDKDPALTDEERKETLAKARGLVQQYLKEMPEEEDEPAKAKPAPGAAATEKAAAASRPPGVTRTASFAWDTKQIPDGVYVLRVKATDIASNPDGALTDEKITEPFLVVNTAPEVFLMQRTAKPDANGKVELTGFSLSRISLKGAQYRIKGGDWYAVNPDDGLWDSSLENFRISIQLPEPGAHKIELKVVDFAGNSTTSTATLTWTK